MNGTAAPYELTVGQAAVLLDTSRDTVRRMVDRGELLARHSPGGHRLIPREAAEAKKRELENGESPPDSGVTDNGDRASTGIVERRTAPAEPAEAPGLTREQVREVALSYAEMLLPSPVDYSWAPGCTPGIDVPIYWTAVKAERARRHMLAWFEANLREGWTAREVGDLAEDLIVAWAQKHPALDSE